MYQQIWTNKSTTTSPNPNTHCTASPSIQNIQFPGPPCNFSNSCGIEMSAKFLSSANNLNMSRHQCSKHSLGTYPDTSRLLRNDRHQRTTPLLDNQHQLSKHMNRHQCVNTARGHFQTQCQTPQTITITQ